LQIEPLLAEFGAQLREINIDADPQLRDQYNVDVPVIFVGGRKVAKHRVDIQQFRRQLMEAPRTRNT
jgi:glutaredoxin